jgi:hypothetical protein
LRSLRDVCMVVLEHDDLYAGLFVDLNQLDSIVHKPKWDEQSLTDWKVRPMLWQFR